MTIQERMPEPSNPLGMDGIEFAHLGGYGRGLASPVYRISCTRDFSPSSFLAETTTLAPLSAKRRAAFLPTGSLLLVDIEVKPLAHKHPLKQPSQFLGWGLL